MRVCWIKIKRTFTSFHYKSMKLNPSITMHLCKPQVATVSLEAVSLAPQCAQLVYCETITCKRRSSFTEGVEDIFMANLFC